MKIRRAEPADLPACVEMARALHGASDLMHSASFDAPHAHAVLSQPNTYGWVAKSADGKLCGCAFIFACPRLWSPQLHIGDIMIYVSPAARGWKGGLIMRGLIRQIEKFARYLRIDEIDLGVTTGDAVAPLVYRALKYEPAGTLWRKRLQ